MALRNCNVDKFKRRRDEWEAHEAAQVRKAEMFADLTALSADDAERPAPPKSKKVRGQCAFGEKGENVGYLDNC